MFLLAKVVQAIGVADVGYALFVGLTEPNSMGRELLLMTVGLGVFSVGRLIERWASARG
jgi:hypothetical protein